MVRSTKLLSAIFGLLFNFVGSYAQSRGDNSCLTSFDGMINLLSDSLNFIQRPEQLPKFLGDHLIDWKFRNYLNMCLREQREKISIRRTVLERVYREDVLKWIISSNDKAFDKRYDPQGLEREIQKNPYNDFPVLPFMGKSIRDLARDRLEEIQEKKVILNGR